MRKDEEMMLIIEEDKSFKEKSFVLAGEEFQRVNVRRGFLAKGEGKQRKKISQMWYRFCFTKMVSFI